jgi:hypothetical protein
MATPVASLPTARLTGSDVWHFTNRARTKAYCGLDLTTKRLEPDTVEATFGYGQPGVAPRRCERCADTFVVR